MAHLLFLLTIAITILPETNNVYSVENIPEDLLKSSLAVVRTEEIVMNIQSMDKAIETVNYAITILEKNGEKLGVFNEIYDNLQEISDIKITIYDKSGEVIKKVKSSEIMDYSYVSDYSIFEDNRQRYYKPELNTYPYTIHYQYSRIHDGLLSYPIWQPVTSYDLAVQQSTFKIISPSDLKVRYNEKNLNKGVTLTEGDQTVYEWSLKNFQPVEEEDNSPFLFEITPIVRTAPTRFIIQGYEGNMDSWDEFGKWSYKLIEGRDALSAQTKDEITQLIRNSVDEREKIQRIYKYMQSKTRYVSIQEGIGGWQPMLAEDVDKLGYGDCKALANYTKALLKIAGIESFYTRVKAGQNETDVIKDFVSNQFNHIILCVPQGKDTIWLECTSQTSPMGYLGDFTSNRNVLIITPHGGKMVRSVKYPVEVNTQHNTAYVKFKSPDFCLVDLSTRCCGLQYENFSGLIVKSYEETKKYIIQNTPLPEVEVQSFSIRKEGEEHPIINFQRSLGIRKLASQTGTRLFIPVNFLNKFSYAPKRDNNRKNNIVIKTSYFDIDSVYFALPDGFRIEALPENVSYKTTFGEYLTTYELQNRSVLYVRRHKMNMGSYPPAEYDQFRQFIMNITESDNAKIVLTKGT